MAKYTIFCNDNVSEMRKQRKMGHVTVVGPSLSNLEGNLATIIQGEKLDDKTAGY